jgi:hypothetical protein
MKSQQSQMKPQDILLLLKVVCKSNQTWNQVPIAEELDMSQSEVSE